MTSQRPELQRIGWREWLRLSSFAAQPVKVKVDTGARSSALHAFDIEIFEQAGREMVRFKVHPFQRDTSTTIEGVAPLLCRRSVRSSEGHESMRPVILTTVELLSEQWEIELTLTRRDTMGFRMLLGRQAVRGRFCIDPSRSFVGGRLKRKKKRKPS